MHIFETQLDFTKRNSKIRTWSPSSHNRVRNGAVRYALIVAAAVAVVLWGFKYLLEPLGKDFVPDHLSNSASASADRLEKNVGRYVTFEDIIPARSLEWHNCYSPPFLCARLTVPMDYHRPLSSDHATLESPPTVNIALVLLPGLNHTIENGNYSDSPLLLNPGGPGGSGVGMVLTIGENIRQTIGEDQDILGFDPRGVSFSTPLVDCFAFPASSKLVAERAVVFHTPSQEGDDNQEGLTDFDHRRGDFHRLTWKLSRSETGVVNSSSASLPELDYAARVEAKLCQSKDELFGHNSILRHVDTPNVARDMLSIIDAWQDWRKSSIVRAQRKQFEDDAPLKEKEAPRATGIDENDAEQAKIKFWGFSYGTLLGATFAAMFPDRVGRMVLDGVVDADHYVSPIWAESIHDTDKITSKFFQFCAKAGEKCALWRPEDTAGSLRARYTRILKVLKRKHGLPILQASTNTPIVYTYSDLKSLLFQSLYSPVQLFPYVAEILAVIETEDESQLGRMLGKINSFLEYYQFCPPWPRFSIFPGEAQRAIMCSDKRYPLNESLVALEERFETLSKASSFSDVWLTLMLGCDGWEIPAKDPPMDWDDHPVRKPKPINTSFPLLFVSNTLDPVTPRDAGLAMALKFKNAGFLEQESEGHCSLSSVSLCTIKKIRAYFREGKIPGPPIMSDKGTNGWEKCKRDEEPWSPFDGERWLRENGVSDKNSGPLVEIGIAWKGMQTEMASWDFFGIKRLRQKIGPHGINLPGVGYL